jgi:hypothetical protein
MTLPLCEALGEHIQDCVAGDTRNSNAKYVHNHLHHRVCLL